MKTYYFNQLNKNGIVLVAMLFFISVSTLFAQKRNVVFILDDSTKTFIQNNSSDPTKTFKEIQKMENDIKLKMAKFEKSLESDKQLKAKFIKDPTAVLKEKGLYEFNVSLTMPVPVQVQAWPDTAQIAFCFDKKCLFWGIKSVPDYMKCHEEYPGGPIECYWVYKCVPYCVRWELIPTYRNTCYGANITIFNNYNRDLVYNGGTSPSFDIPSDQSYCLESISTYHWNNGSGQPPGKIGIQDNAGNVTWWNATATSGQGGAPNVNWSITVDARYVLTHSSSPYKIVDSDPGTWSWNNGHPEGFTKVVVNKFCEP